MEDAIQRRREELLAKGYRPKMVELAIDWAINSAEGMASYFAGGSPAEDLVAQMLPKYLEDAERWILSLQEQPGGG